MTGAIDLTHPIEDAMATYPGLPRPGLHLDHEDCRAAYNDHAGFTIDRCNVGTSLDCPYHRDGADVSALQLNRLVDLETVLVDVRLDRREQRQTSATSTIRATLAAPVHTALLGAGIPIVEHLTGLGAIPAGARTFVSRRLCAAPTPCPSAPSR